MVGDRQVLCSQLKLCRNNLLAFLLIFFVEESIFIHKLGSNAWNICSSYSFFRICRVVGLIYSPSDFQRSTDGSSRRPNLQCVNQPYMTPLNRLQEQVEKTKCRIHFYRLRCFFILFQPDSWSVTQKSLLHKQQPLRRFS